MIYLDDKVVITQEVGFVEPKVSYDGNRFVIDVNGETYEYEVGCVDRNSIEASMKNGVLTIKARRCDHVREDKGSVQEEGREEGGNDRREA